MMTYDDLCHLMSTFFCKWQIPRLSNGQSRVDLVGAYELKLLKVVRSYVGFSARRAGEQEV